MNEFKWNKEIEELEINKINLKIKDVEGYLVKKSSLSYNLKWYHGRTSLSGKCKRSGLKYKCFYDRPDNVICVFTECPSSYQDNPLENDLNECVIVTIYRSQPDFMTSSLAQFYRDNYISDSISSWDEFGCYTTDSKVYNKITIVIAIAKLRPNTQIKIAPPKERKRICLFDSFI